MQNDKPISTDRREFLIKCGWLAAGVTILSGCGPLSSMIPALPSTNDPELSDAITWVQILPNGKVRFYCPRMEMGQGAPLGLSQVVAEELNINADEIECVLPNTSEIPQFRMTVGSQSISDYFEPVSLAGAKLRETLRSMAADKYQVPIAKIKDSPGGFKLPGDKRIRYRDLAGTKPVTLIDAKIDNGAVPRYSDPQRASHRAIGQNWQHPQLESIVTGQPIFARDSAVPGMLYGHVIKPDVRGSQLTSVDIGLAKSLPGIVAIKVDKTANFVGIVATQPWQITQALDHINLKWQAVPGPTQRELDKTLNVRRVRKNNDFEHTLVSQGNISGTPTNQKIDRYFETSYAAHAIMEPRAATVSVEPDSVKVWCGSQDPFFVQRRVAKAIGYTASSVTVYPQRMGGGFGGRVPCQASEEAAILSWEVGKPVHVAWNREAEFKHNYFQPRFSHFISANASKSGKIDHWEHDFVSSPIITGLVPENVAWVIDKMAADEGTARGSLLPYTIKNQQIRYSDIRTPVPIGAWRGLGFAPNVFAIESMMDDLAASINMDPLEFRLKNLSASQQRLANVLKRVAKLSNWDRPLSSDHGLGLAGAIYKDDTYVAVVAEVASDAANQEVHINKIWCVQDSGMVINPDQVKQQICGNIIWGCSMVLKEQISFNAGQIEQNNFDTYEILRHSDTPDIEIDLIASTEKPAAVGESAFGPVAPAICNAIFNITGKRISSLPLDLDGLFASDKAA